MAERKKAQTAKRKKESLRTLFAMFFWAFSPGSLFA
jgi:hypothetical protein